MFPLTNGPIPHTGVQLAEVVDWACLLTVSTVCVFQAQSTTETLASVHAKYPHLYATSTL